MSHAISSRSAGERRSAGEKSNLSPHHTVYSFSAVTCCHLLTQLALSSQRQLSQELPWEDRLMTLAKHFLRLVGARLTGHGHTRITLSLPAGVRAAEGCRFPFSEKHPYEFTRVFPSGIFCSAMVIITETEWRRVMVRLLRRQHSPRPRTTPTDLRCVLANFFPQQFCPFLEFWSARGLFQLYVAALLYAIVHTDKTDDFSRSVMLYRVVASAGMCFMGTFCACLPPPNRFCTAHDLRYDQAVPASLITHLPSRGWAADIFAGILCVGSLKQSRQRREEERERALHDLEDLERRRLELRGMLSLGE